eukprot:scaffold235_cov319-Pavlova_lutheri.AAC.2
MFALGRTQRTVRCNSREHVGCRDTPVAPSPTTSERRQVRNTPPPPSLTNARDTSFGRSSTSIHASHAGRGSFNARKKRKKKTPSHGVKGLFSDEILVTKGECVKETTPRTQV